MAGAGWDGGQASSGLVYISGSAGHQGYEDTVVVQRGAAQSATDATMTRAARIYFWNGTAYQLVTVGLSTEGTYDTASVYYHGANVTLTASATISISPAIQKESGSACAVDSCKVQADAGMISVTLSIVVEPASGTPYLLETVAIINGSTGQADFTEPDDV
jgi:hypothetical protein